jgi:hypothetical protein
MFTYTLVVNTNDCGQLTGSGYLGWLALYRAAQDRAEGHNRGHYRIVNAVAVRGDGDIVTLVLRPVHIGQSAGLEPSRAFDRLRWDRWSLDQV